ncbi:MAG TPA: sulfatase-like hydrolase/transferase [Gaiellaceae bacterium]|nr:sulfatase-like hydrolase/transferase [Gaiellaceae bacterium]
MAVADVGVSRVAWSGRLGVPAVRGAQLLAASGFALAQPLFDLLGKNPEFFAVRGSTPGDIVLFALVVTFAPALVLLAVELLVALVSEAAAGVLHLVFIGFLAAVFGVQALKRLNVDGTTVLIVGSVLVGVGIAVAAWRWPAARSFLTLLGLAPLLFLALFLFQSPTSKLVISNGDAQAAAIRVRATTPVVFLLFDEFPVIDLQGRDGGIDARRFPNFARLAAGSTWYRNTTTLSASTTVAVPAILTGQKPKKGALPIFRDHPNNLFTLLGRRYRMRVIESQTRLCPKSLCKRKDADTESRLSSLYSDVKVVYLHLLAPPAMEDRLPVIDESWGNFGSSSPEALESGGTGAPKVNLKTFYLGRVRDFNRFVGSFRKPTNGPPTLYFIHVLLPHTPWLYLPNGHARAVTAPNAPGRNGELWVNGQLAVQAWQRHLLQVGFSDRLLGTFLRRLHRTGLWDKALVVVTADHGVSFRGGDLRRHPTRTNLAELAFTPLFVRVPNQGQARVVDAHVQTVDILPTVADALGVKIPWRVDGRSVLSGTRPPTRVNVAGVAVSYPAALAQRQASLARQLGLFGSGSWGPEFAGTGAYRHLVGTRVSTLAAASAGGASAHVDAVGSRLLLHYPRRSVLVPSPLAGTLSGVRPGEAVAVALNGRVAAVSEAYRDPGGGPVRFSLLAPESAFRPGRNAVRVFVLGGSPAHARLAGLRTSFAG